MSSPFDSITTGQPTPVDQPRNPTATTHRAEMPGHASKPTHDAGADTEYISSSSGGAIILRHPAAPEPSPTAQYLAVDVDLETLPIPIVRFPGTKMVVPDREATCSGWSAFVAEVAPDPAPVIEGKDQVPYYIAGTLKEAELINKRLREERFKKGQSTIGKQRSSGHIETLGPALFLDDDGDVFAREPGLRALGAAAAIYSSHSYGFPKGNATEPARGGRVLLSLNRPVIPSEYGLQSTAHTTAVVIQIRGAAAKILCDADPQFVQAR